MSRNFAKYRFLWICLLLSGAFPAAAFGQAPPLAADTIMDTTLWVQTSAEYRAIAEQTYAVAASRLQEIAKASHTKPIAIVVDVDETILDNSAFQVHLLHSWTGYNNADWDAWIKMQKADAVPGAPGFLQTARADGIHVFYVTNRACALRPADPDNACPQQAETLANLRSATQMPSIAPDDVMLVGGKKEWTTEKASRRSEIEKNYEIVMLVGDQLSDFVEGSVNQSRSERARLEAANAAHWGNDWFILPNPMYGDYNRVDFLGTSKSDALHGY